MCDHGCEICCFAVAVASIVGPTQKLIGVVTMVEDFFLDFIKRLLTDPALCSVFSFYFAFSLERIMPSFLDVSFLSLTFQGFVANSQFNPALASIQTWLHQVFQYQGLPGYIRNIDVSQLFAC